MTHRGFGYATTEKATAARIRLDSTIALAAEIDAATITFTTGGRAGLRWDEAALRFSEAIAPCEPRWACAKLRQGDSWRTLRCSSTVKDYVPGMRRTTAGRSKSRPEKSN